MTYYGTEISVNYIYAACTLPSERGQGLMRQLIQDAFKVMESRKVALTVIIPADPWLFDYYRDLVVYGSFRLFGRDVYPSF